MKKIYLVLLTVLILSCAFYWYELRPISIRKNCLDNAESAKQDAINADNNVTGVGLEITRADYDKIFDYEYNKCLIEKGFNE